MTLESTRCAATPASGRRPMSIPRDGLVVELLFDGSARDTSGGGHHGVIHGATFTADRFDQPARACLFDGVDDHIVIAPPPRSALPR